MENQNFQKTLEAGLSGLVLEGGPFGRSRVLSVWIEAKTLPQVAEKLFLEMSFDFLENFSVMEIDGALVLSYFLRNSSRQQELVLRASLGLQKDQSPEIASVVKCWPMIQLMEWEASELFGVQFLGNEEACRKNRFLPVGFEGLPLRKSFKPEEKCSN